MKGKKIIFLILALLLPVTLFIFLKLFGRNEFQVPVLHEKVLPRIAGECDFDYVAPYRVPDSVMNAFTGNGVDSLYVFSFNRVDADAMGRIAAEFGDDAVEVIGPQELESQFDPNFLRRCVLLIQADTGVALVDHERRVRGYYDAKDREDVDRLIVEMKIILKQY